MKGLSNEFSRSRWDLKCKDEHGESRRLRNPDNEYCPRCPYDEGESVLFCHEYFSSLEAWQKHIGKPVKFVDEEAVIEAYTKGTQYPRLFHGTLKEVLSIGIITRHTLYARIEPRWTDTPKFVPISQVRIVQY